jgi:hypothetical protein
MYKIKSEEQLKQLIKNVSEDVFVKPNKNKKLKVYSNKKFC